MTTRRWLLCGTTAALLLPQWAWALEPAKMQRVVFVPNPGAYRDPPDLRARQHRANLELFAAEGFVPGPGFALEYAAPESPLPAACASLARRIVATEPTLILVSGDCIGEFKEVTHRIPLVFYGMTEDPVRLGVVASFARPGGNVTGSALAGPGEELKGWELLRELAPRARRFGVTWYADEAANALLSSDRKLIAETAARLGFETVEVVIPRKVDAAVFERAVRKARVDVLDVGGMNDDASLPDIMSFLVRSRIPALWLHAGLVRRGGLVSAAPSTNEAYRDAINMAAQILRGASPATMPVRTPRRYITAINLGTARAMGLAVPQSVLLRADVVVRGE